MNGVTGRTVVVTGANGALGQEVVRRLVAAGAKAAVITRGAPRRRSRASTASAPTARTCRTAQRRRRPSGASSPSTVAPTACCTWWAAGAAAPDRRGGPRGLGLPRGGPDPQPAERLPAAVPRARRERGRAGRRHLVDLGGEADGEERDVRHRQGRRRGVDPGTRRRLRRHRRRRDRPAGDGAAHAADEGRLPERKFPRYTPIGDVADRLVALWDAPAAEVNGTVDTLVPEVTA